MYWSPFLNGDEVSVRVQDAVVTLTGAVRDQFAYESGKLDDGTVFDSSTQREPIEFTIAQRQLIPGFEEWEFFRNDSLAGARRG